MANDIHDEFSDNGPMFDEDGANPDGFEDDVHGGLNEGGHDTEGTDFGHGETGLNEDPDDTEDPEDPEDPEDHGDPENPDDDNGDPEESPSSGLTPKKIFIAAIGLIVVVVAGKAGWIYLHMHNRHPAMAQHVAANHHHPVSPDNEATAPPAQRKAQSALAFDSSSSPSSNPKPLPGAKGSTTNETTSTAPANPVNHHNPLAQSAASTPSFGNSATESANNSGVTKNSKAIASVKSNLKGLQVQLAGLKQELGALDKDLASKSAQTAETASSTAARKLPVARTLPANTFRVSMGPLVRRAHGVVMQALTLKGEGNPHFWLTNQGGHSLQIHIRHSILVAPIAHAVGPVQAIRTHAAGSTREIAYRFSQPYSIHASQHHGRVILTFSPENQVVASASAQGPAVSHGKARDFVIRAITPRAAIILRRSDGVLLSVEKGSPIPGCGIVTGLNAAHDAVYTECGTVTR